MRVSRMNCVLVCLLLLVPLVAVDGLQVLMAVPGTIKSLSGLFAKLALTLADSGHNVHLITSFPPSGNHKNLQITHMHQFEEIFRATTLFDMDSAALFDKAIHDFMPKSIDFIWQDDRMHKLWEKRNDFDVFICMSYYSEHLFPFLMDFKGQFVQIITPGVESVSLSRSGNWVTPAVMPALLLLDYDDQMSFWERVVNLPVSIAFYQLQKRYTNLAVRLTQKYFPDFTDAERYYDTVALSLINGHYALDGSVPLLPNQVEIGAINSKEPELLPKDLADFIDGSGEAGVIYFSLGSAANGTAIPSESKAAFIEAFERIPQRIIWKYEGTDVKLPSNVITKSWMPQQDILGHPKTRAFISHCGNMGTQDAKFHGVPILAVPIAFDQPRNAAKMERKGLAIVLGWKQLTADRIVEALNTLVNDTSYQERMSQYSALIKDQKETPAERAVWWIEYIVRHKGAPQLEYSGKNMYFLQYIMLDVICFWVLLIASLCYIVVKIVKWFYYKCTHKKRSTKKKYQ